VSGDEGRGVYATAPRHAIQLHQDTPYNCTKIRHTVCSCDALALAWDKRSSGSDESSALSYVELGRSWTYAGSPTNRKVSGGMSGAELVKRLRQSSIMAGN
jgi:hypothetical protein